MENYTYNPGKIGEYGIDRMRFELGDTMVEGGKDTAALCDEEYNAVISANKNWNRAKLLCLESIFRRLAYEADTTSGPVTFALGQRAQLWKEMYAQLKKEVGSSYIPEFSAKCGKDYFHTDMHSYRRSGI